MSNRLIVHILGLFPESIEGYLDTSILQKAQNSGLFAYNIHNLTDWSTKNTRRVDDRPYGGGAGTIITIEPLYNAINSLKNLYGKFDRIFYMGPAGNQINQEFLEQEADFIGTKQILIICGHYEGIDARIFDLFRITEISVGPYILSSGELASMIFIDGLVRLIPGVLSQESLLEETFSPTIQSQGEYPQYSRPEEFHTMKVPKVLLSGDHKKIQSWKYTHLRKLPKQ